MNTTQISTPVSAETSAPKAPQKHVTVEIRERIATVIFDVVGEKVNTLGTASAADLYHAFSDVLTNPDVDAVVLISGKPVGFIAGADVSMLQRCKTAQEVVDLSTHMQQQLANIEASQKPVVVAIHGPCLGGGLEVALACHMRIATDDPQTALALPEVMLGLLPGGGGTQRLPRLVGLTAALDMLLTGKTLSAEKAKRIGLVDAVVAASSFRSLQTIAQEAAQKLVKEAANPHPKATKKTLKDRFLEETSAGHALVFRQAKAAVVAKTGNLYPAPHAILKAVEMGVTEGQAAGYAAEARLFSELAMSKEARSLMQIFFAQTSLKRNRFGNPARKVQHLSIVGAGLMGAGIAQVSAERGLMVRLKDVAPDGIARGQKQIWRELDGKVKRRSLKPFVRDQIASRIVGQTDWTGFSQSDVVIEAVFEDLSLKHKVLREIEEHISSSCVIASNTSALPITALASVLKHPERVLGMHYFSPVPKMPLLEIVVTPQTSNEATAIAVDVGLRQGKTVIVVKDGPGFYTTRILAPYLDEAWRIAAEMTGASIEITEFDDAMRALGFPVGPLTLLDEVGIDVAAHVARDLGNYFARRQDKELDLQELAIVDAFVAAGDKGRKAGRGFYMYVADSVDASHDAGATDRGGLAWFQKTVGKTLTQASKAIEQTGRQVSTLAETLWDPSKPPARSHRPVNPAAIRVLREQKSTSWWDVEGAQERMLLRMVNEAAHCFQDGVISRPEDADIGAIFGLGFPPTLGGPLRYIDAHGAVAIVDKLKKHSELYGDRFAPCALLVEYAQKGMRFYP